ncbi:hypothetical protein HT136_12120 [Novosphingobium profundi]|uniref:hypothetical protein n=1 Tax=Novosphingobium profundi TaxID=1774954 RepID=UPI001BDB0F36|nr:hypothetical protein [Novosphingobium profundi]MBT0669107.1 hypothetical protein [Novosphingobium profundi]
MKKLRFVTRTLALAGVLALIAEPAGAAQPKAPSAPAAKAEPKQEDVQNAVLYLHVLIAALESKDVEEPVKSALVGCLYNNSLGTIGKSMDGLIAQNGDKIHRDKPNEVLQAMAVVCGYRPEGKPAAPSGGKGR